MLSSIAIKFQLLWCTSSQYIANNNIQTRFILYCLNAIPPRTNSDETCIVFITIVFDTSSIVPDTYYEFSSVLLMQLFADMFQIRVSSMQMYEIHHSFTIKFIALLPINLRATNPTNGNAVQNCDSKDFLHFSRSTNFAHSMHVQCR